MADAISKVGMMETTFRKRVFRVRRRRPPPATATATPRARRACVRIRSASFTVSLVGAGTEDAVRRCRRERRERRVREGVLRCRRFPIFSSHNVLPYISQRQKRKRASGTIEQASNRSPMRIQIVVARYKEDLKWTLEPPFNQFYYLVYNKGDDTDFEKSRVIGVQSLPNVGMCDHTYLYHLYTHYDDIADVTVFLPASCDMPNKVDTARKLLQMVALRQKACVVDAMRAPKGIYQEMQHFTLNHWEVTSEKNKRTAQSNLTPARLRPFGKWYRYFFPYLAQIADAGRRPIPYWWNRGIFSISKENVKHRPRELYQALLAATSQSSAPETSHYMERAWSTLFFPLINTELYFHA